MTTQQRLSSFGYILSEEGVSKDDHAKLQALGQELESLYSHAQERSKRIDDDVELTSMGKARKKKVLSAQIAESLEKFTKLGTMEMEMIHGPSWALELARLKESMHSQSPKVDPVLAELQHQERRRYLLELDPAEREAEIRSRASAGDFSLLDAALSGPQPSHTFVLPKTIEILEKQRLQSLNPTASARIAQIQRSQRTLSNMVASLKSSLKKVDLFAEPDRPIQFLDAG